MHEPTSNADLFIVLKQSSYLILSSLRFKVHVCFLLICYFINAHVYSVKSFQKFLIVQPLKSNRAVEILVSSPHLQKDMFKVVKHKIEVRVAL